MSIFFFIILIVFLAQPGNIPTRNKFSIFSEPKHYSERTLTYGWFNIPMVLDPQIGSWQFYYVYFSPFYIADTSNVSIIIKIFFKL